MKQGREMLFSETIADETFPNQQFRMHDISCIEGTETSMMVVMFNINENIPCKSLSLEEVPDNCKIVFIEFSIKIQKWICICLYKPPSHNDEYFPGNLSLSLNKLTCKYDNIMLMINFNLTVEN